MAAITVHPITRIRPRDAVAARPAEPVVPDAVPGPDERSLARTTAVVVTSLLLLTGTLVAAAYGAGTLVNAIVNWFLG